MIKIITCIFTFVFHSRLQLEKLNNPNEAIRILNKSHSIEGAKMIAQYFIRNNDQTKAIQFLVISKCFNIAFDLARKHKKMELYAEAIGMINSFIVIIPFSEC